MNELVKVETNLPDTMRELARFVLVAREKLNSVKAEIRAIEKLKLVQEVRTQKMEEASMLSEALLDAEVKLGELFRQIPKATKGSGHNQYNKSENAEFRGASKFSKSKMDVINGLGFSKDQSSQLETLANNKDLVEIVKAEARENDELPTKTRVLDLAAYQKKMDAKRDEYDDFIDFSVSVYKEFSRAVDGINKFEVNPQRMEALRENFDGVMTADNQIQYINMAIDKLNTIKSELRKAKKI